MKSKGGNRLDVSESRGLLELERVERGEGEIGNDEECEKGRRSERDGKKGCCGEARVVERGMKLEIKTRVVELLKRELVSKSSSCASSIESE